MEIKSNKPKPSMPHLGMMIGGPKVGKSTFAASIPNALILDLEGCGYDHIEVEAVAQVTSLKDIKEGIDQFFVSKYDVLVIDHLRIMTNLYSDRIAKQNNVKTIEQVGFGKGQAELKHDMFKFFSILREGIQSSGKRVICIAHSTDRNGEIRLDVDGKIDTMITGMVDFIGNIYRVGPEVKINFKPQAGVEFGCRNKNLAKYNGEASWKKIMEVATSA